MPIPNHPGQCSVGKAICSPMAVVVFLAVACAGLAADLASKHFVFQRLLESPAFKQQIDVHRDQTQNLSSKSVLHLASRKVFPGVKFTLSTNPGVVFSLPMPRLLVVLATIVTAGLLFYVFAGSDANANTVHVGLGFILAGAMGNLYDRLWGMVVVDGFAPIYNEVRDFIDCSELHYKWIFNVADVLLVCGVGLLMLHWLIGSRRPSSVEKQA